EIHLFGSKARGDAGPESDVDLLIVTEHNDWKLKEQIGRVATEILLAEGIYLSIKVLGRVLYQRLVVLEAPFIKNVLREGVSV
ncbi:MAG: nucleotidyltransferase domain-containing protein, partial [Candidatus Omnitrophica bacterium]|nr:nucleotidyltransferase domain-containing protein [Candidatus Omnitrophota bacterium]